MVKKLISLTERECEYLDKLSSVFGISVSELVRRMIDDRIYGNIKKTNSISHSHSPADTTFHVQ